MARLRRASHRAGGRQHALGPAQREEDRSHTLGSINLYSMDDDAFDEQDQVLVVLLASLTSVVAHHARVRSNLEQGLVSRQIIGEAVGILRAQHAVSSEDAFGLLVTASNRMNVKLRTIAEQLVEGTLPYLPRDGSPLGTGRARSASPIGRPSDSPTSRGV